MADSYVFFEISRRREDNRAFIADFFISYYYVDFNTERHRAGKRNNMQERGSNVSQGNTEAFDVARKGIDIIDAEVGGHRQRKDPEIIVTRPETQQQLWLLNG